MKPNQRGRYNGRYNNTGRGMRPQTIFRNTSLESSGPCGKLHGTALQLFEKYQAAAKDALIQNDDVLAETCLQYADHYMHLQNIAIENEQAVRMQQLRVVPSEGVREPTDGSSSEEDGHPVTAKVSEGSDVPEKEGHLEVLDLSVPVAEMSANQEKELQEPSVQKRRMLRPRMRRKKADQVLPADAELASQGV